VEASLHQIRLWTKALIRRRITPRQTKTEDSDAAIQQLLDSLQKREEFYAL